MSNLRERAEKAAGEFWEGRNIYDAIESALIETRNEALEEAARLFDGSLMPVEDLDTITYRQSAKWIRALKQEKDKRG